MTTISHTRLVERASVAVFAVFFLNGFNFATWAARLPAVRDGLGFSPAQMGALLLVGAVGSLLSLPVSGMVVERLGAARTVFAFAVLNASGLVLASIGVALGQVLVVGVGLVLFGVGTGVWDAAMNLEGAAVEQHLGRTIMPRYHAGFSFGTVAAAAIAAVMALLHVPVVVHIPVAVIAAVVVVGFAVRRFLPSAQVHEATAHEEAPVKGARGAMAAWVEPRTLLIGLIVLAAGLTEGSANDWVSLAVVDGFSTAEALGAIAFGVFVAAMTTMRWFSTSLLDRRGRVTVLRLCAVLSMVGLLVFALAEPLWLATLGIVAWGAGAALGFPVGLSAAADDPRRAPARVSVVATVGYSAFLAGPPLIGLLAQHVGYRHALLVVIVPIALGLLVVGAAAPLRPGERAVAG